MQPETGHFSIMDRVEELSGTQKHEVLDFVRSLSKNPNQLDLSQALEPDPDQS